MQTSERVLSTDIERELTRSIGGEVRFDDFSRVLYSTDASIYQMKPLGVVLPRDADDVAAVVETARQAGVSVMPRGGGTGLSGQTVTHGIVLDFSKYMNKVKKVNAEERWTEVQPGITINALNRELADNGIFFTPDPSTASRATIGGAIGNNSCGAHSIIYGKTVDQVIDISAILSDGSSVQFGELNGTSHLEAKMATNTLEGQIYRGTTETAQKARQEVERRFPKIMRRIGGYNLDLIQDIERVNLAKLIVGSEGTLASVTEARLRLEPLPKAKALTIAHFRQLEPAMEATVLVLEEEPAAVEHIGGMIIEQARLSLGFGRMLDFMEGDPSDILVIETTGKDEDEAAAKAERLKSRLLSHTSAYAVVTLTRPEDQKKVWAMREAGLGLMMNIPGDAKPIPFVEDTAVAPERLPEYARRFDEIVRRYGTEAGCYGHASVGCLHFRPVINLKTADGVEKMRQIADEISSLALEFGGVFTGEHGDGIVRGAWAEKMFGNVLIQNFRDIKRTFDPDGLMNPGKIFDTPPMTENLRYGANYFTIPVDTTLDFSEEGGFAAAIEKCNGVGACRKLEAGVMCPSYMATREEEHSTRGRANLLRATITGALPQKDIYSSRMFNALDLCLECKACKSECPSKVDMAKLKSEFLYGYYKNKHRRPLRSLFIAHIHMLNALTAKAGSLAPLASRAIRSVPFRLAGQILGIHPRRRLPKIASRTFERRFLLHKPNTTGSRGLVVFFHDTFTNFNYPEAAMGAVRLLEAAGYRVQIVANRRCCGRPMISKGMLDTARINAAHNVEVLHPFVTKGAKIVGCEASCVATLIDEYPDLLPKDPRAKEVSDAVVMLQELITECTTDGGQSIEWSDLKKEVRLHVHCHEKSLRGTNAAVEALNLPPNYSCSLIDSGCCGMAGSFGFEKEHYEISMRIAEERLLPAVRDAAPSSEIAVTGISCRQQIEDGTNRRPRYLAEILADALPDTLT